MLCIRPILRVWFSSHLLLEYTLILYMKIGMVPCSKVDSMPVSSSFRISAKIPLTIALVMSSLFSGRWSLCESVMGVLAGFFLNPSPRHPHILLHCPSILVKFLLVFFYCSLDHRVSTDPLLQLSILLPCQVFI